MFATSELFGKFHTPRKSVRATAASLRPKNLHQMEEVCDAWMAPMWLAPNAAGSNSRQRVDTPKLTFLTFLSQTMTPGASCRGAVRQVQAYYQSQPVPGERIFGFYSALAQLLKLGLDEWHLVRAQLM